MHWPCVMLELRGDGARCIKGVKGTREHDFTERQDIWTGPVQEKNN